MELLWEGLLLRLLQVFTCKLVHTQLHIQHSNSRDHRWTPPVSKYTKSALSLTLFAEEVTFQWDKVTLPFVLWGLLAITSRFVARCNGPCFCFRMAPHCLKSCCLYLCSQSCIQLVLWALTQATVSRYLLELLPPPPCMEYGITLQKGLAVNLVVHTIFTSLLLSVLWWRFAISYCRRYGCCWIGMGWLGWFGVWQRFG